MASQFPIEIICFDSVTKTLVFNEKNLKTLSENVKNKKVK